MNDPFSDTTNTITIRLNNNGEPAPSSYSAASDNIKCDTGTIAVIITCVILVGVVIVGTILDIILWLRSSNMMHYNKSENSVSRKDNLEDTSKNSSPGPNRMKTNHPTIKHFILVFSLYTTVPNLLKGPSPSALQSLGAMKIFSSLVIFTFHVQQMIIILFHATSQNDYLSRLSSRLIFQPIMNASLAVETFFVISGALSAYLTFKDMEKHKRF